MTVYFKWGILGCTISLLTRKSHRSMPYRTNRKEIVKKDTSSYLLKQRVGMLTDQYHKYNVSFWNKKQSGLMPVTKDSGSPLCNTPHCVYRSPGLLFYFIFGGESERVNGGEWQRERETHKQVPRPATSVEPKVGLDLRNCEIMAWTEIKSQTTDWAPQEPWSTCLNSRNESFPGRQKAANSFQKQTKC